MIFVDLIYFCLHAPNNRSCFNVGKVSTRFEFLPSGFVHVLELYLIQLELGAEFYGESDDIQIKGDHRAKIGT